MWTDYAILGQIAHELNMRTRPFGSRLIFFSEKPPDDPKKRFWFNKSRQKFARFHRLYGNSLSGGVECAKIITVTETETKKKKGKNKEGKKVSY